MQKAMVTVTVMVALACLAPARAADADTPERRGDYAAVTAGEAVAAGAPAGVWTNGLGYAAAADREVAVIGRAEGAAAGKTLLIRRGTFRWANAGGVTDADIGKAVYLAPGAAWAAAPAPAAGAATNALGRVADVDAAGVWVRSAN
jgi:hypothetical protein